MPFRRTGAEALRRSDRGTARQRDFRHQDQRLPAAPDGLGHRLEIDLGLARAGDAVEQRDGESRLRDRVAQRRRRRAARAEVGRGKIRIGRSRNRLRRQRPRLPACPRRPDRRSRRPRRRRPPRARLSLRAPGRSAAPSTRARAVVMRCGGGPARRTPTRSRAGPSCSPMRSAIRSTMPRGPAYSSRPSRRSRAAACAAAAGRACP